VVRASLAASAANGVAALIGAVAFLGAGVRPAVGETGNAAQRDRFDVVAIDAGHGGADRGAVGARGLAEKEVVLDVARRLKGQLEAIGLKVVLTRASDNFVPLEERSAVANDARADLFLSIHANASESSKPRGIEAFFLSLEASDEPSRELAERENVALDVTSPSRVARDPLLAVLGDMAATEYMHESDVFAKLIEKELGRVGSAPSRGVKQAPFVVLMGVQMPSSLVEIGFLSNPKEEKTLRQADQREEIAKALSRAVAKFGKRYDARRGVTTSSWSGSP
jgi:N-acetylmuramoyl-L-alanine amidase